MRICRTHQLALLCALTIPSVIASGSEQENQTQTSPLLLVVKDAGAGSYEAFPDVCRRRLL